MAYSGKRVADRKSDSVYLELGAGNFAVYFSRRQWGSSDFAGSQTPKKCVQGRKIILNNEAEKTSKSEIFLDGKVANLV